MVFAESHDEVDFMTMFTTQNDDGAAETFDGAQHAHQLAVSQPTLPAVDPLRVFDATDAAWSHTQTQTVTPMHMQAMAPVAYAPHVVYHHHALGQPFMPMPMPDHQQYIVPAGLAGGLGARPSSSASPVQPSFSALTAPHTPIVPAERAKAGSHSPASAGGSTSPPEVNKVRRKRKLTPEDKRRICEIYRNSQGKIRQEDIAKEYSVDRSTISKILNQEDRWLDPEAPGANSLLSRRPGGRYPAIEEEMHRWLDDAVMQGREVRDAEAREEALKIGLRLGHPHFQASSKWWDAVKRRRVEEGRAMPVQRRPQTSITPPMVGLARSYTAMSMDAPGHAFPSMPGPSYTLVDPGMHIMPVGMRGRSQSSPQMFHGYAQQATHFGPAPRQRMSPPRHSPVNPLARHRTYHGHGSPSRPSTLHRTNSSQGRPSPHMRLGASAFGLTPMTEASGVMPMQPQPPVTPGNEHHHDGTVTPGTSASASASVPSLSPLSVSVSEASEANAQVLSPDTPRTPAQPAFQPEYMDLGCQPMYQQVYQPYTPVAVYPGYEYVQQW